MNKDLTWAFELYDKMSAQAGTITAALEKLDKSLGKTKKDAGALQNAFGGFSGPVGTVVGGLKYIASTALDVGVAIANIGVGFAQAAVASLGFKESTLVSFKAMTGSAEQAQIIFDRAMKFADLTPFGSKDVVSQFKTIMGAGFSVSKSEDIFAALSDVAAMSGQGAPALEGMMRQLSQAKSIGKFSQADLNIISSWAAGSGFSLDALLSNLAEKKGVDKASVKDMLQSGAIGADEGIEAFLQVVEQKVSKGKLGTASIAQGTTISGLLSTIESFPEKLFYGINLDSAGVAGFKKFLGTLISTFDSLVGKGGRLTGIVERLGNVFGEWLGGLTADRILEFVNAGIDGLLLFVDTVSGAFSGAVETFNLIAGGGVGNSITFADSMRYLGYAVGLVVQVFATLAGLLALVFKGWDLLVNGVDWGYLGEQFKQLGSIIVESFIGRFKSTWEALKPVLDLFTAGITSQVEVGLGIHSPSKVFAELGRQTAAGFALGIDQGLGFTRTSLEQLTTPPSVSLPAGGGGGQSVTFAEGSIVIQVQGGDHDADGLARHLAELLPDAMSKLFGRLAIETGEA